MCGDVTRSSLLTASEFKQFHKIFMEHLKERVNFSVTPILGEIGVKRGPFGLINPKSVHMKLIANRAFLFAITTVGYKESKFLYDERELPSPFNREICVTLIVTLTLSAIPLSLTESGGLILKIPKKVYY
jgi:hypothetical protein